MAISFRKMYGLGNDFIVLDARKDPKLSAAAEPKRATILTDRKTGIGCDQLIILEKSDEANCFMRIINADGSEVGACGNATRCVGGLCFEEDPSLTVVTIRTKAGLLKCYRGATPDMISVDMGLPRLLWNEVPVAREVDTLHCKDAVEGPGLTDCACCSMGNPHATFFVPDCEAIDLPNIGHDLEHHSFFPERCNVSVVTHIYAWLLRLSISLSRAYTFGATQVSPDKSFIRMRVWERGTGITLACGTGACATLTNAVRRGLIGKEQRTRCDDESFSAGGVPAREGYKAEVKMDGGSLWIQYAPPGSGFENEGHVMMTGTYATAFHGSIPDQLWNPHA